MKLKKKCNMILCLICLFPLWINGQDTVTLNRLAQMALEQNYQIQILRKQQQITDNLNTPGNAGMRPTVGVGSDALAEIQTSESKLYTGATRTGHNALNTRSSAWMEANWTVFDGMAMFARQDRLSALASQQATETRFYIEQTVYDLSEAYYQLVHDRLLLEMHLRLLEISRFRLEIETHRIRVGSGNRLMHNQAFIDVYQDSSMVVHLTNLIHEREAMINLYTGQPPANRMIPQVSSFSPSGLPPLDQILARARKFSPSLESSMLSEMISEANIRIEKGQRMPQISVFSQYQFNYQTSETGIVESMLSRGVQAGFRVRFNLYDGGIQRSRINNAALAMEQSEILYLDLVRNLESNLHVLTMRYTALQEQYNLLLFARAAAFTSLEIAREQLQQGSINGYEFRLTQLNEISVGQQLISLQFMLVMLEADIHRLCGALTEEILGNL